MFRSLSTLLALVVVLVPSIVWACPACAARENGGLASQLVVAAMMILPFGVTGVVLKVLKKVTAEEAADLSDSHPEKGEPNS